MQKLIRPALATLWVLASEFIRNELILKNFWVEHFKSLGLKFETLPLNGFLWLLWSAIMVYLVYKLMQKFSVFEAFLITWLVSFGGMWLVTYNLQVLPLQILFLAIPLSMLEIFVAQVIMSKDLKINIIVK